MILRDIRIQRVLDFDRLSHLRFGYDGATGTLGWRIGMMSGDNLNIYRSTSSLGSSFGSPVLSISNSTGICTFPRAGASFAEYYDTGMSGTPKVSIGMLGSPEANVSFNMDYTDRVHRYYDPTRAAIWMAMSGDFALQYAPTGQVADIWDNSGNRYLMHITSGTTAASFRMVLNTNLSEITAGSYDGNLTVPRAGGKPSICGVSDLVLEGGKNAAAAGILYLNSYGAGAVSICSGGGYAIVQSGLTATSTTTGAFRITGGLGVTGATYIGGALELGGSGDGTLKAPSSGATLVLGSGTNGAATLTAKGTGGVLITTPIGSSTTIQRTGLDTNGLGTILSLNSDAKTTSDALQLAFTALDSASASQVYGAIRTTITDPTAASEDATMSFATVKAGTVTEHLTILSTGITKVTATTASTSATTGALVVSGGVGAAGDIFGGATIDANTYLYCGTRAASSGLGGNVRYRDDTGTFRWVNGILGAPAETSWYLYDIVNAGYRISITSDTNSAAKITFNATTASTTSTTGALVVSGGVGVAGAINSAAAVRAHSGTAIPAGGTAGAGLTVSSTANFGVFFGSGAPSLSAAKGSLYLRSDGSTTNNRAYINTDGSTTWTALTTAA